MPDNFIDILNKLRDSCINLEIPIPTKNQNKEITKIRCIFETAIENLENIDQKKTGLENVTTSLSHAQEKLAQLTDQLSYRSENLNQSDSGISTNTENKDLNILLSNSEPKSQLAYMKLIISLKELIKNPLHPNFIKKIEWITAIPFLNGKSIPQSLIDIFSTEEVKEVCARLTLDENYIFSKKIDLCALVKISEELFNLEIQKIEETSIRDIISEIFQEFIETEFNKKILDCPGFLFNIELYSKETEAQKLKLETTQKVTCQVCEFLEKIENPELDDYLMDDLLLFLGKERFMLANAQKSENTMFFGVRRIKSSLDTSLYYVRPYGEYSILAERKIKLLQEIGGTREEFITTPCCLQGYYHKTEIVKTSYRPEVKELLIKNEESVKLSCHVINNPNIASTIYNQPFMDNEEASPLLRKAFQDCLVKPSTPEESKIKIGTFRYLFAQLSPFVRGSALIGEWLEKSLFMYHGYSMEYLYEDSDKQPLADLDAFTSFSFNDFLEKYKACAHLTQIKRDTSTTIEGPTHEPLEIPTFEQCKKDEFPVIDVFFHLDKFQKVYLDYEKNRQEIRYCLMTLNDSITRRSILSFIGKFL